MTELELPAIFISRHSNTLFPRHWRNCCMYQKAADPFSQSVASQAIENLSITLAERNQISKTTIPARQLTRDVLRRYQLCPSGYRKPSKRWPNQEVASITQADRSTSLEKEAQDWWLLGDETRFLRQALFVRALTDQDGCMDDQYLG